MNYQRLLLFAFFAVLVPSIGCRSTNEVTPTSPSEATAYEYSALDPSGAVVASGTLALSFNGTAVTGYRDIKGNVPEAGTGSANGEMMSDGTVQIEIPGSFAVVILKGKLDGERLEGVRLLDTGDPPIDQMIGTFVAAPPGIGSH
jgi:hypothetical protein